MPLIVITYDPSFNAFPMLTIDQFLTIVHADGQPQAVRIFLDTGIDFDFIRTESTLIPGGPNHADCKTHYNPLHFPIIERDLRSRAEALSALTLREGRCPGAGA
jgi:hypothetical protein